MGMCGVHPGGRWAPLRFACTCDRDARIGRGLVAALVYMNEDEPTERHERAALAAFAEAAK